MLQVDGYGEMVMVILSHLMFLAELVSFRRFKSKFILSYAFGYLGEYNYLFAGLLFFTFFVQLSFWIFIQVFLFFVLVFSFLIYELPCIQYFG